MGVESRRQGNCIAVRSLSPSPSISRCNHSISDDATCGAPTWIGKAHLLLLQQKRIILADMRQSDPFPEEVDLYLLRTCCSLSRPFSTSFQRLLKKQGGERATWEYPFAVAGVNLTFMIIQMLDLEASKRRTFIRTVFLQMLSESEWAFDLFYCVAFVVMDELWLEKSASYMEFNNNRKY